MTIATYILANIFLWNITQKNDISDDWESYFIDLYPKKWWLGFKILKKRWLEFQNPKQ